MSIKLQIKRGKKANLPKLAAGEPGFTTDEQKLYIGTGSDNVAMAREDHNHAGVYQPVGEYLTAETDPTVPAWAKAASKPAYTAAEVGADPAGSAAGVQSGLDAHTGNKANPHGVTAAQVGAAPSNHNHSASNITTGTLTVARGGTGQTTLTPAVETKGLRQIYAGTADMTAGSTALATGTIYLMYE